MEQASLNIGTIGQRLEAARQAKGISVSEAGQATKILSKFIEAMEHDDFGALSAPVYAKSFIRMYAQYLGLDGQPLVAEYITQHAPKNKAQLTDEVRQNLASVDHVPVDASNAPDLSMGPSPKPTRTAVFGEVNQVMTDLTGKGIPIKLMGSIVGGIILLLIIVLSVTQCDGDDASTEPTPAGGAASVAHDVIRDGVPDAYLARPGVVEVDTK